MKIFVSYRATGEDQKTLLDNLRVIAEAVHAAGHEPYCTHLQQAGTPDMDKIKKALTKIDESDALLVFVQNDELSEGMSLEIGYAYGKKPIHVFARRGAHLVSFDLANSITEWDKLDELNSKVQDIFPSA